MAANPEHGNEFDLSHALDLILRRRWVVLATTVVVFLATAFVTLTTRPVYRASALLVIEKERSSSPVFSNGALVENSNDDYYQTQYRLLQSYSLLASVHHDLNLASSEDFKEPQGVEKLARAVKITPVIRSRLVNINIESHEATLAAAIANAIAEAFIRQNLSNQLFISKDILHALQSEGRTRDTARRMDALPAVVNNALIQTLKGQYAQLESQAAELSKNVTEKHPALIALRSNMIALRSQIDEETDKIIQSLKTELSGQLRGNNVRMVDSAREPRIPVYPRTLRSLVLGGLGGFALGLLLALLFEALDQTIRTHEDIEAKLDMPFLGLIPFTKLNAPRVYAPLMAKELSLTSEAFRNLRTMIDFAGVSIASKCMLVTSSLQEEGKSFVATNTAVVFAQMGERVLLIDGDLRRPKLQRNFQVSSQHGLSEFLASSQGVDEILNAIQKTDVSNLSILTCGQRPPNPSELLNTPRLLALIDWANANFDRVIVDCPPMFPINDTLLWSRHIRAAIFVVRYGKTRLRLIKNASHRLRSGGSKVLGVVINAAKAGGLSYSSYGYYYQQYYHEYAKPETAQAE